MHLTTPKKLRRRAGQTLNEAVVIIAIIALLASAVGVYAIAELVPDRVQTAKSELKTLESALDTSFSAVGRYPDPSQGFAPLVERRVLKKLPVDPWGTPFSWTLEHGVPVVVSLGADGVTGGDGADADLRSDAPMTP